MTKDKKLQEWAIKESERRAYSTLTHMKKHSKDDKDYLAALESHLIAALMNWFFVVDEIVYLRKKHRAKREGERM